jgi:peptidoglycan hydrolase CwlO-like protein
MEILLAFAVAAVGVACLVVAVTFRARAVKHSGPGIDKASQELTEYIDRQCKRIQDQVDGMKISSKNAAANLEAQIKGLAARQRASVTQADRLETWINALQETVQNARGEFQKVVADIRQTQRGIVSDLQGVQASITRLEARDDQAKAAIDRLGQQISGIRAHLNTLSARIDATQSSIGELQDGLAASKQEVDRLYEAEQELRKGLVHGLQDFFPFRRQLDDIRLFIRHELEHERTSAALTPSRVVIIGGLSADPSSAQIVWRLCEVFWVALSMELLFRYSVESTTCFYLMWNSPGGRPVEECMAVLFRNCRNEHEDIVGLEEFNGILQVLYDGKPAAFKMGSAVLTWSGNELLAGIIAEDQADAGDTVLLEPAAYAARLRQPDTSFFVDLTAWARDYGS